MISKIELARKVLIENTKVRYGIFGIINTSGYFPPKAFLNEFFMLGKDPCDQDGRMDRWQPFSLSTDEYTNLKEWWFEIYPDTTEDALGVDNWNDWLQEILGNGDRLA